MKKELIAAVVVTVAATFASVNVFSDSNNTSVIHVRGSVAAVTSDDAGVAIVASYDSDKRLKYVKLTDIPAGNTAEISINSGDKIMLWNKTDAGGMRPFVTPIQIDDIQPTAMPE